MLRFGKLKKLAKAVRPFAPALSTALSFAPGGPAVNAALKVLASATGADPNDTTAVCASVDNATVEDLVKLRQHDEQFEQSLAKAGIDLERARIADVQDAREKHAGSWMPAILSCALMGLFSAVVVHLLWNEVESSDLVLMVFSAVNTMATAALSYYVGSSRTQDARDRT